MGKFIDLTGHRFGRLIVIKQDKIYIRPNGNKEIRWYCKCDCGNFKSLPTSSLKSGLTNSCGCIQKEILIQRNKDNKRYNRYDLTGKYGIGYTNEDEKFYFDLVDYNKIKNYCWYIDSEGYVCASIENSNEKIKMHRLIMNCTEEMVVDHIYHHRYDNRKDKLRICNKQENSCNSELSTNNTSGVIGVHWHKRDQEWRAAIGYKNKLYCLGGYTNKIDAIKARLRAERKFYGEFAPQKYLYEKYEV